MFEVAEVGWKPHKADVSRVLETAKRSGRDETSFRVGGTYFTAKSLLGAEPTQSSDEAGKNRLRRHIVGEGLAATWEMLSVKFAPPFSLRGDSI